MYMVVGLFKHGAYGSWRALKKYMLLLECLNKKLMVLGVIKQEAYGTWSV